MTPLGEGKLLGGRFRLVRRLGAGGLAEVWVARDEQGGVDVALKVLHEHLVADQPLADRFRRELAVTRELSHPNVVRVFDLYEHVEGDGPKAVRRPFFTMELLRGQPLADVLKAGALPADEARRIARAIAEALDAAHRAGIVHRDLKPHNVMLCPDGAVKLLDFGLARAAGWSRMTAHNTLMGTPGYIAPELLQGKPADARADLYALGATFYEMLTGKRAFAAADPYAALRRKEEAPPSPRAIDPRVSEADDAVVRRALEPDPERRFLDAGQVLRALDGHAAPPAQPASIALTAGEHDVVVHESWKNARKPLHRVCERLGLRRPGMGFRLRMTVAGRNVLVAGASRESAEAVAALCREEGLAASVEAARPVGKLRKWLAPRLEKVAFAVGGGFWVWQMVRQVFSWRAFNARTDNLVRMAPIDLGLAATAFAVLGAALAGLVWLAASSTELPAAMAGAPEKPKGRFSRWLERHSERFAKIAGRTTMGLVVTLIALTSMPSKSALWWVPTPWKIWPLFVGLASATGVVALASFALWRRPGVVALQPGDSALRRLQQGIADRVQRLRDLVGAHRPASQIVLEGVVEAAERAHQAAQQLAEQAAREPAPVTPAGEQAGSARERDAAVDRLLRFASTLDDVIAAQASSKPSPEALERLRHELAAPPEEELHTRPSIDREATSKTRITPGAARAGRGS